jgi:ABC-type polysaccharide/polyol phosphate export permease
MQRLPTWLPSLGPLALADVRRRYAGSTLGAAWAVLAPVLEVAAYAVVFGWILGTRGAGMPYAVLIASGLFPWISLRESLEGCANVLSDHRWIRRSRVPTELLVARLVLGASTRALVGLVVVYGFALLAGRRPGLDWIWPLIALAVQVFATYGLGLVVAPLGTIVPDVRPTLASLLTLFTFAAPIVYPESLAQGFARTLLLCNPFTHLLRLLRSPIEPLDPRAALGSATVALAAALTIVILGESAHRRLWWRARDAL